MELNRLDGGGQFAWNWLPARGHSGGLLLGLKTDTFEVGEWKIGEFFVAALVYHKARKVKWWIMVVYWCTDQLITTVLRNSFRSSMTWWLVSNSTFWRG